MGGLRKEMSEMKFLEKGTMNLLEKNSRIIRLMRNIHLGSEMIDLK